MAAAERSARPPERASLRGTRGHQWPERGALPRRPNAASANAPPSNSAREKDRDARLRGHTDCMHDGALLSILLTESIVFLSAGRSL